MGSAARLTLNDAVEPLSVSELRRKSGRGEGGREGWGGGSRRRGAAGADGRNSRLARFVQAPTYEAAPTVACWYFSYWSGVSHESVGIYLRRNKVVFAFPTNDGLFAIFIGWPIAQLPTVRADIEGQFIAALDEVPELAERVRSGRREERFAGAIDVPNFLRKPYGQG